MAPTFLLVRHAAADAGSNGSEKLCGWFDAPLTEAGRRQVELLRGRLAAEKVAAVYASPLRRAAETASAAPAGVPVEWREELREINCGAFEGKPLPEIENAYADLWNRNLSQTDEDFHWPGGESYRDFRRRAITALRSMASCHPDGRVLVVTHAGFINQVLGAAAGVSAARWEAFRPGNASITEVEWDGDTARLIRFDDRDHLRPLQLRQEASARTRMRPQSRT